MARDDDQFAEFVTSRRTRLRRTAYALCGDWHAAEDLVQTALAKLYVAWPRVEGAQDAYVRRILVNASIDEHRRPWRRERATEPLPERAHHDVAAERSALVDALQLLPPMQRRVVVLRRWLDVSVEDTAAELGISTGTVKSHTSRALTRLHELLADGEHDLRSTR
ncbi:MAG: sigE 4 [Nocardioidaceae bacterium]|nr:sigE 4 [Nocardioidaceae bacterium]